MRMVTASRGPRACALQLQLLLSRIVVVFVCSATNAFAQDRVILFEPFVVSGSGTFLPGQIREIQINQGSRAWSQVRSVPLPPHAGGPPVALADGSRIAWLAVSGNTTVLVQYDATTARASIVDIGAFDRGASLVSDPATPRLYVIEPRRVTFIDYRLQPTTVELSGTKTTISAYATGSHLILHRRAPDEVVVIDPQTAATINVIPVDNFAEVRVSRSGRLYTHYGTFDIFRGNETWFAVRALSTGALITRTRANNRINFFEVDDSRRVVIHEETIHEEPCCLNRRGIVVRDATSLAVIGEFAPGLFNSRCALSLRQTASQTILMFSRERDPLDASRCLAAPRIDIFDGTTFAPVNRIDLQGRYPVVVPLPTR